MKRKEYANCYSIAIQLLKFELDEPTSQLIELSEQIKEIETLKHTNQALIETLDEVLKIQEEGRNKRREAEHELARIEGEIKAKLLEINA